jgi:hypothetical protein
MDTRSLARIRAALCVLLAGLPAVAGALPNQFAQEGLVLDAHGDAIEGNHDIHVKLYDENGQVVFDETHVGVGLVAGYYSVLVGSQQRLDPAVFQHAQVNLGLAFDGGAELRPRTPLVKVPAAFAAEIATNAVGDVTPHSVSVGGHMVIDAQGRWVGDPTGLSGPAGPAGPAGPVGPVGPAGPAGGNADPAAVVPLVVGDLAAHPDRLPFLRKNADDSTTGTVTFNGGHLEMRSGATADSLRMNNNNITGVNALTINDPGPNEGVLFGGTQAKIVVSGANNADGDGALRLVNDDGINLESNALVTGDLTVNGALHLAGELVAQVARITTAHITNANIANANVTDLNGPNNRVSMDGDLALQRNVVIGANTTFVGDLRTGSVTAAGSIAAGQNLQAGGSISAGGNVQTGPGGQLRAGTGGIFVGAVQVFDGNGNLLREPGHTCPAGQLLYAVGPNGATRCLNVTCAAGSAFRGFDGNLDPVCEPDDGLPGVPPNNCPAGQALVSIAANGATACRAVGGAGNNAGGVCPSPLYMVGFYADGNIECNCQNDGQCPAADWCNGGAQRCTPGCRDDNGCPNDQWCNNHQCVAGCRSDNFCPNLQWCDNHRCRPGCKNDGECGGNNVCRDHQCVPRGVNITPNNEAYGHHGACSGWNGCGNAQTCASWACQIRGAQLISYGRTGSCRTFRVCHLFFGACCAIQWNWGNWCDVAGVGGIVCSR